MKKLSYFFAMLMMAATVSFTACKDDDDDKPGPGPGPDPEPECEINTANIEQKDGFLTIIMKSPEEICQAYICGNVGVTGDPTFWAQNESTAMIDAYTMDATECEGLYWVYYVDESLVTGTLEFKFTAGPAWTYEENIAANRNYVEGQELYEVESWKLFLCGDEPVAGTATFTVTVPECTPADAEVSIVGSFGGVMDWTPGAPEAVMTKNEDGTYSITLEVPASLSYKYVINGTWDNTEEDIDEDGYAVNLENRVLATTEEVKTTNDVVKTWKGTTGCAEPKPEEPEGEE